MYSNKFAACITTGRWTMGKWIFNLTQLLSFWYWYELTHLTACFRYHRCVQCQNHRLNPQQTAKIIKSFFFGSHCWKINFHPNDVVLLGIFIDYCANNEAKQLIRNIASIFGWIVLQSANRKPIRICWPWYSFHFGREKHIRIRKIPPKKTKWII